MGVWGKNNLLKRAFSPRKANKNNVCIKEGFKMKMKQYCMGLALILTAYSPIAHAEELSQEFLPLYELEAIEVTAEKRVADVQDVPISMDVLTSQKIEDAGINSIQDAARKIPNLSLSSWGTRGNAQFFIRGLGSVENTPAVGFYVDDVGYLDARIFDSPLYEIERIEFLRGPQGTLYGRNTLGGVINVVTKKPDNEVDMGFEASYSSYDTYNLTTYLRTPLIEDTLFLGLSGSFNDSDGYFENTLLDQDADKKQDYSGRLQLLYTPTEELDVLLSMDAENIDDDAYPIALLGPSTSFNPALNPLLADYKNTKDNPYEINHDYEDSSKRDSFGTSLKVSYEAPWFDITSISAFRMLETRNKNDQDFGPYDVFVYDEDYQSDYFTQELRFSSSKDDASPFQWVGGLFASTQTTERDGGRTNGKDLPYLMFPGSDAVNNMIVAAGESAILPAGIPAGKVGWDMFDEATQNMLAGMLVPASTGGVGYTTIEEYTSTINTYAVFGQGTYTFFDKLDLTLGLRYEYEEGDFDNKYEDKFYGIFGKYDADMQNSVLLPKVALAYHWTDDVMSYASIARGYRGGGFNYTSPTASESVYDPEFNWTYELGLKTSFFDNRLNINGALFYMDIQDQQVTQLLAGGSGLRVDNAAKSRSMGFEIDVNAVLLEGLLFEGSFGYTDTEFKDYMKTDFVNGVATTRDFSGKNTPLMPEYTYSLALQYSMLLTESLWGKDEYLYWTTRAELDGFGTTYFTEDNSVKQDPYSLVNLRTSFDTENYSLIFWVNNVFDEEYAAFAFRNDMIGALAQLGAPRTFGMTFKMDF